MQNFNATTNSDGVYKATEKLLNGNYRAVAKYVSPNGDVLSEEVVFSIDVPDTYTITGNTSVNERTATVSGNLTQISNDLNNGNPVANAEVIFHLVSGTGSPDTILTITNDNGDYTLELRDLENGSYVAYVEYTSPTNGYVARTPNLNFVVDVKAITTLTLSLDNKADNGYLTFSGYLTNNGLPQANKTVVVRFSGEYGTVTASTDIDGKYTVNKIIQVNGDYTATAEFSVSGVDTVYSNTVNFSIDLDLTAELTLSAKVGAYPNGRRVDFTLQAKNVLGALVGKYINIYEVGGSTSVPVARVHTNSNGIGTVYMTDVVMGVHEYFARWGETGMPRVDSNIVEVEITQAPSVLFEIISIPISDSEARITGNFIVDGKPTAPSNAKLNLLYTSSEDVQWSEDIEFNIDGTFDVILTNPLADGTTFFVVQAEAYYEQVWMSNIVNFNAREWKQITLPYNIINGILVSNNNVLVITKYKSNGEFLITTDGVNFSSGTIPDATGISTGFSYNNALFFIEGNSGYVHKSIDNGVTWEKYLVELFVGFSPSLIGVAVQQGQIALLDSSGKRLLVSNDAGLNWQELAHGIGYLNNLEPYLDGYITSESTNGALVFISKEGVTQRLDFKVTGIVTAIGVNNSNQLMVTPVNQNYLITNTDFQNNVWTKKLLPINANNSQITRYVTVANTIYLLNYTGESLYTEDNGISFKKTIPMLNKVYGITATHFKGREYVIPNNANYILSI